MLDILVVDFNSSHVFREMYEALQSSSTPFRILVVDNASVANPLAGEINRYPGIYLEVNQKNIGFGRANNQLLPKVQSDYVLLLNTDAFVAPDTLNKTVAYMKANPDCGVLGVRLVGRDGELQPSCRYFPSQFNLFLSRTGLARFFPSIRLVDDMAWDHASVRECDWVPGCYYLIRRTVLDQVGLFDPRFFLYYEEVDHCRRVKEAGWKVVYFPDTQVVHIGGESAKSAGKLSDGGRQLSTLQLESELLYFRKHYGLLGLLAHIFFLVLGDLVSAAKHMLRGHFSALAGCWTSQRTAWHLLLATRFATRPTR